MLRWFPRVPVWTSALTFERRSHPIRVDAVIGACMAMRRDLFCEVGGFSPDYFMYAEDRRPVLQDPARRPDVYYVPRSSSSTTAAARPAGR